MVVSARRSPLSPFTNLAAGIIRTLAGKLLTETISRPFAPSQANPLQLIPPTLPGIARMPCSLGGLNMVWPDMALIASAHNLRSPSEIAQTASGPWLCGTSAGVVVGKGWVGELFSP